MFPLDLFASRRLAKPRWSSTMLPARWTNTCDALRLADRSLQRREPLMCILCAPPSTATRCSPQGIRRVVAPT